MRKFAVKVKIINKKSAAYKSLFDEVIYGLIGIKGCCHHDGFFKSDKRLYLISAHYGESMTKFSALVHKYYGYWPNLQGCRF